MLSKKEIKDIQSLSQKKFRDELNQFIAEGTKVVSELIELIPGKIEKVYALKEWLDLNSSAIQKTNVVEVSSIELAKIAQLQTPNKVVAVVKRLASEKPDTSSFALYLDTIQDPGNFGTIVRTADWFGIKNIVCTAGCADLYNPKVVQATMASIARVNVYYDEREEWLKNQTCPIVAATLNGTSLYDHSKLGKGVLIIGNESKGIRKEILQYAAGRITIPRKGDAESLNAAVATGIILSHLLT